MAPQANFHFFHARMDHAIEGIRASEVADPYKIRQGLVPSLVVGPQLRVKNEKPVRWARIIPPGVDDVPRFAPDRNGHKIVSGSIAQVQEGETTRSFLVAHRDEQAYYVLVRTGLVARPGRSAMDDRLDIQKDGRLVSHGSYSFDSASIRVASADNESLLDAFKDTNAGFGRVAAERMQYKSMGKNIPLLGCSETSYVLWKMPIGAVLLIRDINGKLWRLVAEKNRLRCVDAAHMGTFFEALEDGHKKFLAQQREARKAAAQPTTALGEALAPLAK